MHNIAEKTSGRDPQLCPLGASDIICAVRPELDGHTPAAVEGILREQLSQWSVEVSDAELQRVAADIAAAGLAKLLAA